MYFRVYVLYMEIYYTGILLIFFLLFVVAMIS